MKINHKVKEDIAWFYSHIRGWNRQIYKQVHIWLPRVKMVKAVGGRREVGARECQGFCDARMKPRALNPEESILPLSYIPAYEVLRQSLHM